MARCSYWALGSELGRSKRFTSIQKMPCLNLLEQNSRGREIELRSYRLNGLAQGEGDYMHKELPDENQLRVCEASFGLSGY